MRPVYKSYRPVNFPLCNRLLDAAITAKIISSFFLDQCLRIYDTSDGKFKLMKTIHAKDVGWSVLDTAFRCVFHPGWWHMVKVECECVQQNLKL